MALHEILLKQRLEYERKLKETYIRREIRLKGLETHMISVIIGPRRAGKSFFCMHALHGLERTAYVNFDDETLLTIQSFDEILTALEGVYGQVETLLLDEIQNLPDWELIANRLQREGYRLVLTGSNSKLLSSELSTHLTGRHYQTCLLTFSFREILNLAERDSTLPGKQALLSNYLNQGGFPEPWVKGLDFRDYLSALYDSVLYRDIIRRHRIRFPSMLEGLAKHLISSITGEFTARSLASAIGAQSDHTMLKYYSCLEEAFLFFRVPRFSFKVKDQVKTAAKLYCYDNGFMLAKGFNFSTNTGKLLENAVAVTLKQQELDGSLHFFYWKNEKNEEVDFVVQKGVKVERLIQVCADLTDPAVGRREVRALLKAGEAIHCTNLTIVTLDVEKKEKQSWFGLEAVVEYIPFGKWSAAG